MLRSEKKEKKKMKKKKRQLIRAVWLLSLEPSR